MDTLKTAGLRRVGQGMPIGPLRIKRVGRGRSPLNKADRATADPCASGRCIPHGAMEHLCWVGFWSRKSALRFEHVERV